MSKECKPNTALVFDLLRCYTFFYGNNQFFNRYTSSQQSTHTVVDLPDDFPLISEKNTIEEYKKLINFYMTKMNLKNCHKKFINMQIKPLLMKTIEIICIKY